MLVIETAGDSRNNSGRASERGKGKEGEPQHKWGWWLLSRFCGGNGNSVPLGPLGDSPELTSNHATWRTRGSAFIFCSQASPAEGCSVWGISSQTPQAAPCAGSQGTNWSGERSGGMCRAPVTSAPPLLHLFSPFSFLPLHLQIRTVPHALSTLPGVLKFSVSLRVVP